MPIRGVVCEFVFSEESEYFLVRLALYRPLIRQGGSHDVIYAGVVISGQDWWAVFVIFGGIVPVWGWDKSHNCLWIQSLHLVLFHLRKNLLHWQNIIDRNKLPLKQDCALCAHTTYRKFSFFWQLVSLASYLWLNPSAGMRNLGVNFSSSEWA